MRALGTAKQMLETLSTMLVIVAASALIFSLFFERAPSASVGAPAVADVVGVISAEYLTNTWGSGQIAIVEFSDFQCPFCAKHARETVPALKKALAGKVRYIVANLPVDVHPYAVPAAEAAECAAEQGKYWEMYTVLFERQSDLATADYVAYAHELGLDASRLQACLAADEKLAKIAADKALAERLEIRGTPTLFLGRLRNDGGVDVLKRINGARSVETFLAEVGRITG